jgi:hypothetical protein
MIAHWVRVFRLNLDACVPEGSGKTPYGSTPSLVHNSALFASTLRTVARVVACFTKITDFHLLGGLGLESSLMPLVFSAFADATWPPFGSARITSFFIRMPFDHLEIFFSKCSVLGTLDHFSVDVAETCASNSHEISFLAPFVNRHASTLRRLDIIGDVNWSKFFGDLTVLPVLQHFTLRTFLEQRCLLMLTHILHDHAGTIQHFELDDTRWWDSGTVIEWMTENLHDDTLLANLTTLSIEVPRGMPMDVMAAYIGRSAATLTSLRLYGCALSHAKTEQLLNPFTAIPERRLSTLLLAVKTLTPNLVALLAETFPGLQSLSLVIPADADAESLRVSTRVCSFVQWTSTDCSMLHLVRVHRRYVNSLFLRLASVRCRNMAIQRPSSLPDGLSRDFRPIRRKCMGHGFSGFIVMNGPVDSALFLQIWLITQVDEMPCVYKLRNLRSDTHLDLNNGESGNGIQIQGWEGQPNITIRIKCGQSGCRN